MRSNVGGLGNFVNAASAGQAIIKTVYILRSLSNSDRYYTGICDDMAARLAEHNAGNVRYTKSFVPWKVIVQTQFEDEQKAFDFEKYLKSGSGRAFAKRHF